MSVQDCGTNLGEITIVPINRAEFVLGMRQTNFRGDFGGDLFRPILASVSADTLAQTGAKLWVLEPKLQLSPKLFDAFGRPAKHFNDSKLGQVSGLHAR